MTAIRKPGPKPIIVNELAKLPEQFAIREAQEIWEVTYICARNRLSRLKAGGHVESVGRGRYRKTADGRPVERKPCTPTDWVKRLDDLQKEHGDADGLHLLMLEWTGGKLSLSEKPSREAVHLAWHKTRMGT